MAIDALQKLPQAPFIADRRQHQLQLAAAGKPVASGFILADSIGRNPGFADRQRLVADAKDQIVLHTTAGYGTGNQTVAANREHCTSRPRGGSPCLDDGGENHAMTLVEPRDTAAQYL